MMLTEKEVIQQIKSATPGTILDTGVNLGDRGQGSRRIYECIGVDLWRLTHAKPSDTYISFWCEIDTNQVLNGFKQQLDKSKVTFKQKERI